MESMAIAMHDIAALLFGSIARVALSMSAMFRLDAARPIFSNADDSALQEAEVAVGQATVKQSVLVGNAKWTVAAGLAVLLLLDFGYTPLYRSLSFSRALSVSFWMLFVATTLVVGGGLRWIYWAMFQVIGLFVPGEQ